MKPIDALTAEQLLGVSLAPGLQHELTGRRLRDIASGELRPGLHELALHALGRMTATRNELASEQIEAARQQYWPHVRELGRLVAMANGLIDFHYGVTSDYSPMRADDPSTPRAIAQSGCEAQELNYMLTAPNELLSPQGYTGPPDGLLILAPPGAGKTKLQADVIRRAGIGKPTSAFDSVRKQALVVLSDQTLLRQYAGDTGDTSFRDFLGPDIHITRFFQEEKNTKGDVILTLPESLLIALDKGTFDTSNIAFTALDEGHLTALAPAMLPRLSELSTRKIMFTATSGFSGRRDLRKIFPHHQAGTMREFIEQRILRRARLYTYQVPDQQEAQKLAASLAIHLIPQGKRVGIYARPGQELRQGKYIAQTINGASVDTSAFGDLDYDGPPVWVAGGNNPHDPRLIRLFNQKKGPVAYCATGKLKEGFNGPVDAIIIIGPRSSLTELEQISGRALRPGDDAAMIIEIMTGPGRSIWEVFGLEEINQGFEVGPPQRERPHSGTLRGEGNDLHLIDLPPDWHEFLVQNKPLREIVLSPDELERSTPKEGYEELELLAAEFRLPESRLQRMLDTNNVPYMGIWQEKDSYKRWYAPEARQYLEANKESLVELPYDQEKSVPEIARQAGVSAPTIQNIVDRLGLEPTPRLGRVKSTETKMYDEIATAAILDEVAKIPWAEETDVPLEKFSELMGRSFVRRYTEEQGIPRPIKRFHPGSGLRGVAAHISQADAEAIRTTREQTMVATSNDISIIAMCALSGLGPGTITYHLTPEHNAMLVDKYTSKDPDATVRSYLPRNVGLEIVEKLKRQTLPAHLLPLTMFVARLNASRTAIHSFLHKEYTPIAYNLGMRGRPTPCFPIAAMQAAERRYGVKSGQVAIDYQRTVQNETDDDRERWEYTQSIAAQYINPSMLDRHPDKDWLELASLLDDLQCTIPSFRILLGYIGVQPDEVKSTELGIASINKGAATRLNRAAAKVPPIAPGMHRENLHSNIAAAININDTKLEAFIRQRIRLTNADFTLVKAGQGDKNRIDVLYTPAVTRAIKENFRRFM